MDYRVSAEDRASFKRCRRQWDLGSIHRQRMQPLDPPAVDLTRAIRDALAVYYYPGMWDWQSAIVLPLVRKEFMRSIAAAPPSAQRMADLDAGTELLEQYMAWAPAVDDFGPLKIEIDVEALVPDVRGTADHALGTSDGARVLYTDRIAMVATDEDDEYWVVLHSVVPEWGDVDSLLLDETAVAACWAWEQTYLGAEVVGTIHNELRSPSSIGEEAPTETRTGRPGRGGCSQNEPSGGGRLLPRGERPDPPEDHAAPRVEQEVAGPMRRTRIRRGRAEIEAAAAQVGTEALEMLDPELRIYPTPSARHCPSCVFRAPCLTMTEGEDPALDLATRFRQGPKEQAYEPRLGAGGGGGRSVALPGRPPEPGATQ